MDLDDLREIAAAERSGRKSVRIRCCMAAGCLSSGSARVKQGLDASIAELLEHDLGRSLESTGRPEWHAMHRQMLSSREHVLGDRAVRFGMRAEHCVHPGPIDGALFLLGWRERGGGFCEDGPEAGRNHSRRDSH